VHHCLRVRPWRDEKARRPGDAAMPEIYNARLERHMGRGPQTNFLESAYSREILYVCQVSREVKCCKYLSCLLINTGPHADLGHRSKGMRGCLFETKSYHGSVCKGYSVGNYNGGGMDSWRDPRVNVNHVPSLLFLSFEGQPARNEPESVDWGPAVFLDIRRRAVGKARAAEGMPALPCGLGRVTALWREGLRDSQHEWTIRRVRWR